MSYSPGKSYVIKAVRASDDKTVYVDYMGTALEPASQRIARVSRDVERRLRQMRASSARSWDTDDDEKSLNREIERAKTLNMAENPFGVTVFELTQKASIILSQMRSVQHLAVHNGLKPNSIELQIVDVQFETYQPEEGSEMELEMRKIALDKLSDAEKDLLKVRHWDVYHKLGHVEDDTSDDDMPF